MRPTVTDGTNVYIAAQSSLQKIVASTGVSTSLLNNKVFLGLTYGNSTLYAFDQDALYSVDVSDGTLTEIVKMQGITEIAYFSSTHIVAVKGNSLVDILLADGTYTYVTQSL